MIKETVEVFDPQPRGLHDHVDAQLMHSGRSVMHPRTWMVQRGPMCRVGGVTTVRTPSPTLIAPSNSLQRRREEGEEIFVSRPRSPFGGEIAMRREEGMGFRHKRHGRSQDMVSFGSDTE